MGRQTSFADVTDLPANRYCAYRGKDDTERYVIAKNATAQQWATDNGVDPAVADDDCLGAFFAAAADSGNPGTRWKSRYDAAPDKAAFADMLGRALALSNDRAAAAAHANVAWIHRTIGLGTSREDVTAALQQHGLRLLLRGDRGTVSLFTGSSIGCGREIDVGFTFEHGRLTGITESPESQTCM
ncbi:MAG TPA: hypothetical protein VMD91_19270 [Candidatus Sulfotelmatobacter sp.]|nr:hypothetical protein [Candidatus Sulfotelmatobacter sp.]